MSAILTVDDLIAKGACSDQVRRFRKTFGDSVIVTADLAAQHADRFDWNWAARNLLPVPLRAEYDRQLAALWAALYIRSKTEVAA